MKRFLVTVTVGVRADSEDDAELHVSNALTDEAERDAGYDDEPQIVSHTVTHVKELRGDGDGHKPLR